MNELILKGLNRPSGMRHLGRTSHHITEISSSARPQSKLGRTAISEQMLQLTGPLFPTTDSHGAFMAV